MTALILIAGALGLLGSYYGLLRCPAFGRINSAYRASRIGLMAGLVWIYGLSAIVLLWWSSGPPWQFWTWLVFGLLGFMIYVAMTDGLPLADMTYVPVNVTYWLPYLGIKRQMIAGRASVAEVGLSEHSIDVRRPSMSQADVDQLKQKIAAGSIGVTINRVRFHERAITSSEKATYTTPVSVRVGGHGVRPSPSQITATIGDLVRRPVNTVIVAHEKGARTIQVSLATLDGYSLGGMTVPVEVVGRLGLAIAAASTAGRYLGPLLVIVSCLLAVVMRVGWMALLHR